LPHLVFQKTIAYLTWWSY